MTFVRGSPLPSHCQTRVFAYLHASGVGIALAASVGMITILLIVLLVLALGGGAWGHSRVGFMGWSPAALIVLVLVVLWLTGNLHA